MANLESIINQLKSERDRIDEAIAALTSLNGTRPAAPGRGRMSASARARISAAQKARWAKQRSKGKVVAISSKRPKRHISAAGIARIRAAAKARWAKVRAAKRK